MAAGGHDFGEMGDRMHVRNDPAALRLRPEPLPLDRPATTACTIGVCTAPGQKRPGARLAAGRGSPPTRGKGANTRH